jgi:hypothetical protein
MGRTALDCALALGLSDIIDLLKANGAISTDAEPYSDSEISWDLDDDDDDDDDDVDFDSKEEDDHYPDPPRIRTLKEDDEYFFISEEEDELTQTLKKTRTTSLTLKK